MFTMTVEKLKAFLAILLVSGYAGLSRPEMYLKIREDCHNLVVSAMMTKTEFLPTWRVSVDKSMVPYFVKHGQRTEQTWQTPKVWI